MLALAATVLLLGGCRSMRQGTTTVPPDDGMVPSAQREYSVANFSATVEGMTASGQLRLAADSVVWVSVNKVVELGRAVATVDSVWASAPMAGIHFAGTYDELSRLAGRTVTFAELQEIASADNAEERIAALAREMGFEAAVKIRSRRRVEQLAFPYNKKQ